MASVGSAPQHESLRFFAEFPQGPTAQHIQRGERVLAGASLPAQEEETRSIQASPGPIP